MKSPLFPDRHKQQDFFICDFFDSYKDDMTSMSHPVFSLSTKPDHRVLEYEHNGNKLTIRPSDKGLATIHDKDVLLYLMSNLMMAKNNNEKISNILQFTAYNFMISTNRVIDGRSYQYLKETLHRLKGMTIETNIKTNGICIDHEFSLLDYWKIVREDKNGRMVAIEVKLSDWFYNSILDEDVLTIDKEYFRLRKPTDKRLYEIARKHCGNQEYWHIKLENLKLKLGISSPLRTLRFNLKKLVKSNHLPEYNIKIDEKDIVSFTRKQPPKPPTKTQIEKSAKPGESYIQVKNRLSNNAVKNELSDLRRALTKT